MALAAALPEAHVELIEATGRKCDFMERALEHAAIHNARVVCARAEEWGASRPPDGGRGDADVVTARAVGRLSTLAELASPLLREGGALVAWKGRRDPEEEAEAARAAERLAMELEGILATPEAAGFEHRHLYLYVKSGPTPHGLPRRAGHGEEAATRQRAGNLDGLRRGYLRRSNGTGLRDRKPEGRGGEDHHRRQHRRLRGHARPPGAARGPRPAVQRDRRTRRRPRGASPPRTSASPARSPSPRRPGPPAPTTSGWCPPAATSPARRWSCRGSTAPSSASVAGSDRFATASRSRCSTARPRSAP